MTGEYLDLSFPGEKRTVGSLIEKSREREEVFKSAREGLKKEKRKIISEDIKKGFKDLSPKSKSKSKLSTKLIRKQARFIQKPTIRPVQQVITQEQRFLQGMFGGGERTFGTGQNLPKADGVLIKGKGLINNDDYGETGKMFGMGK